MGRSSLSGSVEEFGEWAAGRSGRGQGLCKGELGRG